jgi:hypothetical protein
MTNPRVKIKRLINTKQDYPSFVSIVMGDGQGNLAVDGKPNYIYAMTSNGNVAQCLCIKVAPVYGASAYMGIDPTQPSLTQILNGQASAASANGGGSGVPAPTSGYAPANRYRWYGPNGGGQDPLFSEMRQFMPMRLSIISGMTVGVYVSVDWTGSEWVAVSVSFSLTSYAPTSPNTALFVLITIDNTGTIIKTAGSPVTTASLAPSDIPAPPAGTRFVVGAVRLYYGQTKIQESKTNTDIVDLRGFATSRHFHDVNDLDSGSATNGQVPTANGSGGVAWEDQTGSGGGGGGSITSESSILGSDFTLTTVSTFYDVLSLSLVAGKWLIIASAAVIHTSAYPSDFTARLWDGTTVSASGSISSRTYIDAASISISAIVTPTTTTNYHLSVANDDGGSNAKVLVNGGRSGITAGPATYMNAIKIG